MTATSPATATTRPTARGVLDALDLDTRMLAMVGALGVIWVVFDLVTGGVFLTPRNLWNLAVQTSSVATMATGMVLVIVARYIDLSVGALLGLTGMVMAVIQARWLPGMGDISWIAALVGGALLAGAVGGLQGWWIAYRGVPAFIVTLAGLLIYRGLAWWMTSGQTVAPLNPSFEVIGGGLDGSIGAFWSWVLGIAAVLALVARAVHARRRRRQFGCLTRPLWAEAAVLLVQVVPVIAFVMVMNAYLQPRTGIPMGIPVPVLIVIAVTLVMTVVATRTRFGRYVFAIGGNPEAAELSGINVKRITVWIFVVMGLLVAVGAAIATARLKAGLNATGELDELRVIAAAVIGGTSLAGGVGTIFGAVLGALTMQSLQSGMVLLGLPSPMQNVVIGAVLVFAVWLDQSYRRGKL
ncbi:sugar ABC transporter permease [Azospirillum sp. RWY-5-1]|uniref:Xylose transport system permease protein XylH n=1 Tax=Azospirillum oleiclasticum TaxID=2735135 RepID=A0ABX2TF84_9PROT|nr:sugar ABC transporter permease [Azospirillum oleiclasticum]NYZ16052.1 sugar ABC transporter permease [Azospirillum oleiclasticum]NYZ22933.1 sugar ABC transporter permease [Azospirillum oleiclasticum]